MFLTTKGSAGIAPVTTVLLTSSGTYTVPVGATWLEVTLQGPGCGGSGSGSAAPAVTAPASDTTFGSLTAVRGAAPSTVTGGAKVTATTGDLNIDGQKGADVTNGYTNAPGGIGGGPGGGRSRPSGPGEDANPNSGGGGGGGGSDATAPPGGGGGGGARIYKVITSPAATYAYNVGPGSAGGAAGGGTLPMAGGAGAAGYIMVVPHYN